MTRTGEPFLEKPAPEEDRRAESRGDADVRAHHDAIYTLARAAELHDADTGDHVVRIRLVVEHIARKLGYADPEGLGYDAMLHDVGKLMIPPDVLRKPGKLTDKQRQAMESHTVHGERLLSNRPSMRRASIIARSHHERMDGSGYPDALIGEAIPIEARITAVADVLDALVSARCYKDSWTLREAMDEVLSLAPTQLDPRAADALRACEAEGQLSDVYPTS